MASIALFDLIRSEVLYRSSSNSITLQCMYARDNVVILLFMVAVHVWSWSTISALYDENRSPAFRILLIWANMRVVSSIAWIYWIAENLMIFLKIDGFMQTGLLPVASFAGIQRNWSWIFCFANRWRQLSIESADFGTTWPATGNSGLSRRLAYDPAPFCLLKLLHQHITLVCKRLLPFTVW
jgi:hypothetical protein